MSVRISRGMRRHRFAAAIAVVSMGLVLTACGSDDGADGEMTMWVRHTEGEPVQVLVDLWNSTHDTQIDLTVIPGDTYQQKVGAAAGSNSLPDILGSDVVYSPNYVADGIYLDITDLADSLPFKDDLSQAHQEAASKDGKIYGLPLLVESSLIIYNKSLYEQAGLDPEAPPTSFDEIYEQASAVRALGGDIYGFYFAGNCAGCMSFSVMPYAAAAGMPPLSDDGTKADVDSDAMASVADLYRKLFADDLVPSAAQSDDGATWTAAFNAGQIGILPVGTFNFGGLADVPFDWGIAPLPAPDGSASATFVGGDVVGITRSSNQVEAATEFLEWSLTDEPQLEVWAKGGFLTPRYDLADNDYTADNAIMIEAIEGLQNGYTPATLPYGEIFNSATGPWLQGLRAYIFNGDDAALAEAQEKIQVIIDDAQ
ncbi:hypothetical protein ASF06_18040 [Agreia sp. Leaf244]|uniref:ABC transporter substrate-binding protein n=1 Tax=Agreia sp. Leaf244 TaxID=1736305 RepID=UPI0006FD7145|nr:sugar ABC transporter substrate-binding protein [Agreia sp. Leaf244]KQO05396.1 hypothetical protein ASF06_18040 [Agreia sp. Leaf244]